MCVGKVGTVEVDFIAMSGRLEYFQIVQTMLDETTRNREFAPLEAVVDGYLKTVLIFDRVRVGTIGGLVIST